MAKKIRFEGNLTNRLMEGENFTNREIKVGDDITMYYWSDRDCYYVTDVISQKEIKVLPWQVCADQEKPGGMGHQDWLYFRTVKEMNDYLNSFNPEYPNGKKFKYDLEPKEPKPQTWVYRYNKWMKKYELNYDTLYETAKQDARDPEDKAMVERLMRYYARVDDEKFAKILNRETVYRYEDLSGKISFGVKDYYYDWEF